jgi:uncharacterized protein (TIGR03066 family)
MKTCALALGCLLLGAGAARAQKSDARQQLVGKWETTKSAGGKELRVLFEFSADNKLTVRVSGPATPAFEVQGTYKFLDDNHFEVRMESQGRAKTEKTAFRVTADTLELTGEPGAVDRFRRVR